MKAGKIAEIINGKVICGECQADHEVEYAFASDLMSDVLTIDHENVLLITGLTNLQAIRTAEMADIRVLVFVRNKQVTEDIINLANENGMILIECPFTMYKTSGLLYQAGVKPLF